MLRAPSQPPYFINAAADLSMIGGASILAYLALLAFQDALPAGSVNAVMLSSLPWVINGAHFSATNYRLYHALSNVRQYPLTALLAPPAILAGALASLAAPGSVAPYFVKLYLLWSPYHYSGQTVGISLIYARRAGVDLSPLERRALSGFVYGTFIASTARVESGRAVLDFFGIAYPTLGLPLWTAWACEAWMWGWGALLLILLARRSRRERRAPPAGMVLPALAQFVWFIPGSSLGLFFQLVPLFHGLQYLLIAWFMQLQERAAEEAAPPTTAWLARESARWGVLNYLGYLGLFWALPRLAAGASGLSFTVAAPIAVAAVQIHHFFVDGVIWKLKNPRIGPPLMGSLGGLLKRPP